MRDIKTIKEEIRKWERKRLSAIGRSEFFGMMIIENKLEKLKAELEDIVKE